MVSLFRRPAGSRRQEPVRRRSRARGCLLWILAVIVILIALSLLFGGFQKGTKADAGYRQPVGQQPELTSVSSPRAHLVRS